MLLLPILSENGWWLMEIDFVCLASDSLTTFDMALPIMLYLVPAYTCILNIMTIMNIIVNHAV